MNISVTKLTDKSLMHRACSSTLGGTGGSSGPSLHDIYKCEHSPIRTQLFWVEMEDIPTFVSVHLVRHKIGVEHYVETKRDDRGGDGSEDRDTPVHHCMLLNAQTLINMAKKRLCSKAHKTTQTVMRLICERTREVDPELYPFLVPDCIYRGEKCHELKPCSMGVMFKYLDSKAGKTPYYE